MNIKGKIEKTIEDALDKIYRDSRSFGNRGISVLIEIPKEKSHGDYSTNIALILAKGINRSPVEIAKEIVGRLTSHNFEKVEVAGLGFINFYLSRNFFVEGLKKIDKNFGRNSSLKGKKIIVEYTDANPFKEFHIGHLMSNSIGESLSRIFEFQGAAVKRANYQGDVGVHVAKAIWGKMESKDLSWGEAYAYGAQMFEEDQEAKKEIVELNKKIYEKKDKDVNKLYEQGKKESLEKFEVIYKTLGTKFDYYFLESQVADFGKKIVEDNVGKVFEKGEKGAIVFKGEKYGLHTRVFINSEGLPTYEAKELGLAKTKYNKYKYHQSFIVTANEVNEYFKVLLSAMSKVFPDLAEKTTHIGHGILRPVEGKMSSRTGNVTTFESLLEDAKKMIAEKIHGRHLPVKEQQEIIQMVAVGALKYSILKQNIGSDIIYDSEKSISFEGDSGPYLQYSYARAMSVLKKAKKESIKPSFRKTPDEISQLEKMMVHFPEVVEKSRKEYEPHLITTYLTELARDFNNYYAKNKIVDRDDELSPYKVVLTEAFSMIMKNGLWLLGIQAPEKM